MVQYQVGQWVSALFLLAVIVWLLSCARSYYRTARKRHSEESEFDAPAIAMMFVWIANAFIGLAVAVFTVIGRRLGIIIDEMLGLGYYSPTTMTIGLLWMSIMLFFSAGLIMFVGRKAREKNIVRGGEVEEIGEFPSEHVSQEVAP